MELFFFKLTKIYLQLFKEWDNDFCIKVFVFCNLVPYRNLTRVQKLNKKGAKNIDPLKNAQNMKGKIQGFSLI